MQAASYWFYDWIDENGIADLEQFMIGVDQPAVVENLREHARSALDGARAGRCASNDGWSSHGHPTDRRNRCHHDGCRCSRAYA